jgi:FkbM family methyltransferase
MKQSGEIWLPDGDHFFVGRQDYEMHDFTLAMEHVTEFRNALDIGAHVGLWSRRLADRFGQVLSFEPVPDHHECLVKNIENTTNVYVYNVAVGNEAGTVYMNQSIENSGMSSIVNDKTGLEVSVITVDSLDLKDIDFIKIDVEGFESLVLKGAEKTILESRPVIFMEILNQHKDSSDVFSIMADFGYEQVTQTSENYIFKFKETSE